MKVARFHLVGYLISGAARLRDHIERIDDGAAYAADDLAVVLRLLVSGVSGGQLISRTAQSFGIPLPKIGISAEPEPIQGLVWGAGALPTAETLGTAGLADINQLRFKTALRIQTGSKRMDLTWDKLIRDYASYWGGAHVGESIRDDVHLADRIGTAAGLPLITYMLREIAVAAWYSAQFVLRNAIIQDDPEFFRDPMLRTEKARPGSQCQAEFTNLPRPGLSSESSKAAPAPAAQRPGCGQSSIRPRRGKPWASFI
jgi:hypothetical protein